ncbi:MAG: hypothetical protein PHT12_06250 [Patescibacteria group bacterium]|nr:hypothetical protein [Patescibacteria group bacterium]
MKCVKVTTWADVFEGWRAREASNPGWVKCATEIKGWPDWESWRRFTASQIGADQRTWQLFEFTDPAEEIPKMLVGPYSNWQSRLPAPNTASFEDLLNIPEQAAFFGQHDGVISIMNGLPFSTEFIGLVREDTNKIVCLEGHHRAVAIALAKRQGKLIDFGGTRMTIALANLPKDECRLLDEALKRGSSK